MENPNEIPNGVFEDNDLIEVYTPSGKHIRSFSREEWEQIKARKSENEKLKGINDTLFKTVELLQEQLETMRQENLTQMERLYELEHEVHVCI